MGGHRTRAESLGPPDQPHEAWMDKRTHLPKLFPYFGIPIGYPSLYGRGDQQASMRNQLPPSPSLSTCPFITTSLPVQLTSS